MTLLLSWHFYHADERLQHKPHNKFPPLSTIKWLSRKYVQIVKNLFYKTQEGAGLYKRFMIYRNTPLLSQLQSPMQILHLQTARSQLPMSNVARKQHGLDSEQLRVKNKNEQLPKHDLHIGQSVMYQDPVTKQWYPATVTSLCPEPRSYRIRKKDGITYRKMQNHVKPYQLQHNKDKMKNCDTWTLKSDPKQINDKQTRPKHNY